MFILITYDVETVSPEGQKRLRQVARQCKNYGLRVQNSVFECEVTEVQFIQLKDILNSIIDPTDDSIRFYFLNKNQNRRVICLGKNDKPDIEQPIIL